MHFRLRKFVYTMGFDNGIPFIAIFYLKKDYLLENLLDRRLHEKKYNYVYGSLEKKKTTI
jgi:hypothetical protein